MSMQIMYSKQILFEYRDKPNKLLARLLAGTQESGKLPSDLITKEG